MTDEEIKAKVNACLAEEFELDPASLTPEARIHEDLGLDSLDLVDMVVVIEKTFQYTITNRKELAGITTVGDIHAFILAHRDAFEAQN